MTLAPKDAPIERLVDFIRPAQRGWVIVDHWDSDRCATALARAEAPRRLVYVSSLPRPYQYECEVPHGTEPTAFTVVLRGESTDMAELLAIIEGHLG